MPFDQACQEIAGGAGSQFDPVVVEAFAAILPDLPNLHASLHERAAGELARAVP
jgi:response regulator RpfG family c-di-GMP phosphodiesterase